MVYFSSLQSQANPEVSIVLSAQSHTDDGDKSLNLVLKDLTNVVVCVVTNGLP